MPDWIEYVRRNLRLRGFRPEREAEIVEEVARQLEDAYTDALRLGASEERAGEIARRHVGDWAALAHELEEAQRGKESAMTNWQHNAEDRALHERGKLSFLAGWRGDVLYGLRVLAKNPGFTTVAVLTLALCIGANTAIFSVINAVMFKALPIRDPQHLMLLQWSARGKLGVHSFSSYGDCENRSGGRDSYGCSLIEAFPRRRASAWTILHAGGVRLSRRHNGERKWRRTSSQRTICLGRLFPDTRRWSGARTSVCGG